MAFVEQRGKESRVSLADTDNGGNQGLTGFHSEQYRCDGNIPSLLKVSLFPEITLVGRVVVSKILRQQSLEGIGTAGVQLEESQEINCPHPFRQLFAYLRKFEDKRVGRDRCGEGLHIVLSGECVDLEGVKWGAGEQMPVEVGRWFNGCCRRDAILEETVDSTQKDMDISHCWRSSARDVVDSLEHYIQLG